MEEEQKPHCLLHESQTPVMGPDEGEKEWGGQRSANSEILTIILIGHFSGLFLLCEVFGTWEGLLFVS